MRYGVIVMRLRERTLEYFVLRVVRQPINCSLCGRQIPVPLITLHHLLPKQKGGGPEHTVPMCRPCHGHLHALYDNHTLAVALSSLEALRRDPKVMKFVKFIRKQDVAASFRSRPPRERR